MSSRPGFLALCLRRASFGDRLVQRLDKEIDREPKRQEPQHYNELYRHCHDRLPFFVTHAARSTRYVCSAVVTMLASSAESNTLIVDVALSKFRNKSGAPRVKLMTIARASLDWHMLFVTRIVVLSPLARRSPRQADVVRYDRQSDRGADDEPNQWRAGVSDRAG